MEMIVEDEIRLDLHTQKWADRPTQLTSRPKPAQCLTLGQIRMLVTLRFTRHLVLFLRDVIAL